jgi:hypothetical protein
LAIAELEILPRRQIRSLREYAVSFPNVTGSGPRPLREIIPGLPEKR